MPASTPPLTVDRIVDVACRIIDRDGLAGLSMRKLGAELGVDPMAVYHHVPGKRELLTLVTAREIGAMAAPDAAAPWDERVRQWATGYWTLVAANRDLTLAGLSDASIAAGGIPSTEPLVEAIAASGIRTELVEPTAFMVVDAIHGSALSVGSTNRPDGTPDALRAAFETGLEILLAGIRSQADRG
jgi:AcrR family transcriptional regulator